MLTSQSQSASLSLYGSGAPNIQAIAVNETATGYSLRFLCIENCVDSSIEYVEAYISPAENLVQVQQTFAAIPRSTVPVSGDGTFTIEVDTTVVPFTRNFIFHGVGGSYAATEVVVEGDAGVAAGNCPKKVSFARGSSVFSESGARTSLDNSLLLSCQKLNNRPTCRPVGVFPSCSKVGDTWECTADNVTCSDN